MDDITFCLSDCQRTDCFRHPSNIQDRTIPHSYADFKETETCPEFAKDINVPINDSISRRAAIDAADRADYTGLAVEDVKKVTDEVVKELKQLPSAQTEIVRCKDCVWNRVCRFRQYLGLDGYCSRGERQDG